MTETETYTLVVVDDGDGEWGYNVKFDRSYNILTEDLPIDSDTMTRVLDEAYGSGYPGEKVLDEFGDETKVGTVVIKPDGSIRIDWEDEKRHTVMT